MTERLAALVPEATIFPLGAKADPRGPGFRDRTRHGGQSSTRSLVSLKGVGELLSLSTSDQTRQPAEFKHITKRRKRNQPRFP